MADTSTDTTHCRGWCWLPMILAETLLLSTTFVPNTDEESAVKVLRGVDARRKLSGLDQILIWFE